MTPTPLPQPRPWALAVLLLGLFSAAAAPTQPSVCSSDGQPVPVALLERFISADCAGCWQDSATPAALPRHMAIDWIVPGTQGDDAPLSAAAARDALTRLAATAQPAPTASAHTVTAVQPGQMRGTLRVAHGLPLNGYVGAAIAYQPPRGQPHTSPLTAWLLLTEAIPAGTEGTPVPRQLARNLFITEWQSSALAKGRARWQASPVMGIPEGTDPSRLKLLGWVQDAEGRVLAAAQSRCRP